MTEAVCLQWIYSMHECAGVHNAMTTLTGLQHNNMLNWELHALEALMIVKMLERYRYGLINMNLLTQMKTGFAL